MDLDISHLTEEDLINLNRKIVARLKALHEQKQAKAAAQFRLGDIVSFHDSEQTKITGFITSIRTTRIRLLTENGEKWTVSSHLIGREDSPSRKLTRLRKEMFPNY